VIVSNLTSSFTVYSAVNSFVARPMLSDAAKASLLERTDHMREVAEKTGRTSS
jgi:hypothetical protein